MKLAYPFNTKECPGIDQVGGKAQSLITTTGRGFPVPAGFCLSVAFFEHWMERVLGAPEWATALRTDPAQLRAPTADLKKLARSFSLDERQREVLRRELVPLRTAGAPLLLAVRSSSPEEDLEELSFAGGYETVLGVTEDDLPAAIGRCFASCLDERVFAYKREHGLSVERPRIAVIVQRQVEAETAGVAFSLNPLNNAYDQAVINANFGLGESVVSGAVSPDSYVVDKLSRKILEKKLGNKESAVWSSPGGGTFERPSESRTEFSLSEHQVPELTDLLVEVERLYAKPIDIEWAFSGGKLFLLQARPITAYFPLHPRLLTAPGEPKRLYADATMAKWGMGELLSVMGSDYMRLANQAMLIMTMGDIGEEGVEAILLTPA